MTYTKSASTCLCFAYLILLLFLSLSKGYVATNFSLLNNFNTKTMFINELPVLLPSIANAESSASMFQISSNVNISFTSPIFSFSSTETVPVKSSEIFVVTQYKEIASSKVDNKITFGNLIFTPHKEFSLTSESLPLSQVNEIYQTLYSSSNLIEPTIAFTDETLQPNSRNIQVSSSLLSTPINSTKVTSTITFVSSSFPTYFKVNEEVYSFTESSFTPAIYPALERNKALYFLSFKSEDCPPINTNKLNRELLKTLSSLGVRTVSADITKSKCQTSLNVNITVTAKHSAILKLQESKTQNLTVFIFNRAFEIIDIQKLDTHQKDHKTNSSLNPTGIAAKNELKAYVAVGGCFSLVVLVGVTVCCLRCFVNGPRKRLRFKNNHTPLTPEDYTLTPIPRPTSLYVDYYRNSLTGDLYSTTSAGSVGSTSPTGEPGVVQPFDTSIVPLEDSDPLQQPSSAKKSSVSPCKQNNATEMVTMDGLIYCNQTSDSTEKLNLGNQGRYSGVKNPLYSRKY